MWKPTLVNKLAGVNPELHVYREGDYSSIDPAWCTWMTEADYEAVLEHYALIREIIGDNARILPAKEWKPADIKVQKLHL